MTETPKQEATTEVATKAKPKAKAKPTEKVEAKPGTEVVETPPAPKKRKRKSKYLDKKELLAATIDALDKGVLTDKLATMLQLLTKQYATSARFASYSYNDDMQSYAMVMLVRTWDRFKPDRSDNAFAFYTQCIKNSFKQYLKDEKKHRIARDELLLDKGMTPSYTYMMENAKNSQQALYEDTAMPIIDVTDGE